MSGSEVSFLHLYTILVCTKMYSELEVGERGEVRCVGGRRVSWEASMLSLCAMCLLSREREYTIARRTRRHVENTTACKDSVLIFFIVGSLTLASPTKCCI